MQEQLLSRLKKITEEEQRILNGQDGIRRELYSSQSDFVIDSRKLLEKGRLIDIRPHTRFAHFPSHRHNYVEMVYMCSGRTTHILGGKETIVLEQGDLLFLNQHTTQEILEASEEDIAVNFIILPEFFNRTISMIERENLLRDFLISTISGKESSVGYLHFRAGDILPVQNLIENMIWTLIHNTSGCNTVNVTTMGLLLMNLSLFFDSIDRVDSTLTDRKLVFAVLKYIESHYRDGRLSEIAEALEQPAYAVSRLLKKQTGANFKELLQERKLQQAAYLLSQTTLSAEAILDAIGYDNSSYFYRRFKEKYGCSPKEYRTGSVE
ncbi:MAG: helix-turn-helix domain-containing protein [Ruminococcaceae bacterium]|nr:helix-turn-helix domain-containing protein [Oscillospiraceae bacterium]